MVKVYLNRLELVCKILVLIFLTTNNGGCQSGKIMFDVDTPHKGFIIQNDVNLFIDDKTSWYVPTINEIITAEEIIKTQLPQMNHQKTNQTGRCPVIHRNLGKYVRQYIGYKNLDGNKIIFVNMIWNKNLEAPETLRNEYRIIFDGCSYFWRIKVDLVNRKLFGLEINGSS